MRSMGYTGSHAPRPAQVSTFQTPQFGIPTLLWRRLRTPKVDLVFGSAQGSGMGLQCWHFSLGIQIGQSGYCLHTSGPKASINYIYTHVRPNIGILSLYLDPLWRCWHQAPCATRRRRHRRLGSPFGGSAAAELPRPLDPKP